MNNSREEIMKLFQTNDVAKMLFVHPRTLRRWAQDGKIAFLVDRTNGYKLYPLAEINRIRKMQQMPELSDAEAIDIWRQRHGGYYND